MKAFYDQGGITIYHADAREFPVVGTTTEAVIVTDPPYGIGWRRGRNDARGSKAHAGIAGDEDTTLRDEVLEHWADRPAAVFGSLGAPKPPRCIQTLIWHKPPDAGVVGSVTGFRRDVDAIYLCGRFPRRNVQWSSVLRSCIPSVGNPSSPAGQTGHPHAKPLDLTARLIELAPGTVYDPFMGSGTTLVAAKQLGRKAIGFEVEERWCQLAAERLSQEVLPIEELAVENYALRSVLGHLLSEEAA